MENMWFDESDEEGGILSLAMITTFENGDKDNIHDIRYL